ncbi:MAG TPA: V-type ATP synthase subunit E family protein [Anaerolineae bacterium]|nr:V-type ATP synthase subunit E family protein [Anaerolineae bacterium]
MSPQQGNIQALENAIMAEARRETRQILEEARRQAEQLKLEAQLALDAECEAIVQQAQEEVTALQGHAGAAAQLEAQSLKLQRREQLLSSVFSAARQRIADVPQWPDYGDIVRQLIQEAVAQLNAPELQVRADAATQAFLTEAVLAELSAVLQVKLSLGEPLPQGTGVLVETPDGRRRYDNTLETRLTRITESLRTNVYNLLRGDTR